MPIARHLDAATRVLRTTISGTVSLEDLREHFQLVRNMGAASRPEIIDARHVIGLRFGARDLPKLAQCGREVFTGAEMAPRAFVVEGMVYFGIARVFASLASGWVQINVFDSMEPAESWLLQFLVH
jgi:hypothetical protein